jgi:hypothetical protein
MSQAGILNVSGGGGGGTPIMTLTGNTGGPITPTANNINVVGTGNVTVAGTLATSTLTISTTAIAYNYVQINHASSPYSAANTDYYISADPTLGTITVLLPNAPPTLTLYIIKDRTGQASTNNISVTTVGGVVTIDGATTVTMKSNYESIELLFNGTSYEVY